MALCRHIPANVPALPCGEITKEKQMKKYTQEEFDAIPRDEQGVKQCPTGDYTAITRFGEGCSFGYRCRFGEGCSFGYRCSFGEWCRFGEGCSHEGLTNTRYIAVDRIGSSNRKTYFFLADEGYFVRAGCYFGKMSDFIKRVKEVHAGTKHEKAYLAATRLAKILL